MRRRAQAHFRGVRSRSRPRARSGRTGISERKSSPFEPVRAYSRGQLRAVLAIPMAERERAVRDHRAGACPVVRLDSPPAFPTEVPIARDWGCGRCRYRFAGGPLRRRDRPSRRIRPVMDRRAFIAHGLAVILGSGIGYAQPSKPIPRIGYLLAGALAETPS